MMADDSKERSESEILLEVEESAAVEAAKPSPVVETGSGGGGWGGWGFSPLSYLTDLQRAASVAAEEISRNAVEAARTAAKSISETIAEDPDSPEEGSKEVSASEEETDDENDERRKAALDKLEKASEESLLSQGLKVLDTSVESFASGAWQALGSAWKGGATLAHKIENSASNLADSIQQGGLPGPTGSAAPSFLETGKALTAKGMQVLEQVGKETMDLLISETGMQVDKNSGVIIDEDQLFEEITFDRCFYIYGGPEQLEELEALANHYVLLYNRRKAKLSSEEKTICDGKLKDVQHIFDLAGELDGNYTDSEKGKQIEAGNDDSIDEWKKLHDSSIRKAAELAAGFATALAGLPPNDITQRTSGRLDTLHSEGVHRLSEMCCFAVTQFLMLGKSIISNASKIRDQEIEEENMKIDWPEDPVEKAKIIRTKAQSMTGSIETVFNSFITGISDVAEAYLAAITSAAESNELVPTKSVQEKAKSFNEHLRADHSTAVGKMQDGLQYLTYLVLSTSMPTA
ncbi:hypothetical protein ABFS82_02G029700 [Erythranthe guttata]|uniref:uncharacterized protein LOC105957592 n=1 Tax=Erythranthe guttata TaxID=4155 RepID=UPI00064DBE8B|nr:PREDICTED: uncharacterized protein LOC105957592 [Erythranthe guttata]|eukprot:XP_012836983.1 PREDICTED: uncharacterized protein LOC105957592 [Erythranthe guttata]